MRGENVAEGDFMIVVAGSSPHARGKLYSQYWESGPGSAHPRMRGENIVNSL